MSDTNRPPITITVPFVPIATKNKVAYVSPGVVDSEGFLTPPPASTLLIRRTKTNSSGSSTFVVSSPQLAPFEIEDDVVMKDNEPASTSTAPNKTDGNEKSAAEILMSDILEQGSSSGYSVNQTALLRSPDVHLEIKKSDESKSEIGPIRVPKLIISKVKTATVKGNKRGPRGKYKKRKQVNIDHETGKRRYTRKKMKNQENAALDTEDVAPTVPPEVKGDSDSDESIEMKWLTDNGVWSPMDDMRLIYNMTQLQSLSQVHIGVRFSRKFTLDQITERWSSLFLNERINHVSNLAIKKLHPIVKDRIRKDVMFSSAEEDLIKEINELAAGNPDISVFEKLLHENIDVFFKYRTPRTILKHWMTLRELNLLNCQADMPDTEVFGQFESDLEDDKIMTDSVEPTVIRETAFGNRALLRRMKSLDIEIKNLVSIADNVILKGSNVELKLNKFNNLATLKGRKVQYLMKSKEMTFGRRTEHNQVDVDLHLEGNANQVSRLQGKIVFDTQGNFHIYNFGRHAIFIDGAPLYPHSTTMIEDESLIMIGRLSLVFNVNHSILRYGHILAQEMHKGEQEQEKQKSTEPNTNQNENEKVQSQ